jgi:hypothetical protein
MGARSVSGEQEAFVSLGTSSLLLSSALRLIMGLSFSSRVDLVEPRLPATFFALDLFLPFLLSLGKHEEGTILSFELIGAWRDEAKWGQVERIGDRESGEWFSFNEIYLITCICGVLDSWCMSDV